ncbi:MAG: hypothetical protein WEB58_10320 [Planctomycetaceae bacterium]
MPIDLHESQNRKIEGVGRAAAIFVFAFELHFFSVCPSLGNFGGRRVRTIVAIITIAPCFPTYLAGERAIQPESFLYLLRS